MQVVLVMFRSDGERRSFSVVRNMTIIGRREDCDLRIPVSDVSRKHCRLVRTDDGIRIEDLGSSNGTYVNAQRIQESELNAGDVLGIGPVQFTVQIDGIPRDEELQPPSASQAQMSAPAQSTATTQEMGSEVTELEEIPAEEHFAIEEEPATVDEQAPVADLEELATEQQTPLQLDDDSRMSQPELPIDEHLGDAEFMIEDEPAQADAVAPVEESAEPIAEAHQETTEHPGVPPLTAEVPLDDFEDLTLDEAPLESAAPLEPEAPPLPPEIATSVPQAPAIAPVEAGVEDFEFDAEPSAMDVAPPPVAVDPQAMPVEDSLEGELELDESALMELTDEAPVLDPAAPVAEAPAAKLEPAPLELSSSEPAYDEVSIDSDDEQLEELTLDEAPAATGAEAGESSWDFVIEESDSTRSHHDFKLDLDSPHEQTHG